MIRITADSSLNWVLNTSILSILGILNILNIPGMGRDDRDLTGRRCCVKRG